VTSAENGTFTTSVPSSKHGVPAHAKRALREMPLESGWSAWAKELAGFTITRLSAIVELTTYDIVLVATIS
jgi:hypothetical protein